MGKTVKLHTRVAIPMEVSIPAFTRRTLGAECSLHSYAVVACILHCGATANAGHYTVRYLNHMSPREAPEAPPQWIADDSKPTQSVRIRPINDRVYLASSAISHYSAGQISEDGGVAARGAGIHCS